MPVVEKLFAFPRHGRLYGEGFVGERTQCGAIIVTVRVAARKDRLLAGIIIPGALRKRMSVRAQTSLRPLNHPDRRPDRALALFIRPFIFPHTL